MQDLWKLQNNEKNCYMFFLILYVLQKDTVRQLFDFIQFLFSLRWNHFRRMKFSGWLKPSYMYQSVQFLKQPIQTTPSCCSCCQWPHMVTLLCTVTPLRLQGKVVSHWYIAGHTNNVQTTSCNLTMYFYCKHSQWRCVALRWFCKIT